MDRTTKRWIFDVTAWTVAALASMLVMVHEAAADGRLAAPANQRWSAECGSCHVAYPPGLLPAQSWRRLMSGLDRHFGADASLEPAAAAEITAYLERNAATGKRARGAAGSLRISESAWFVRKHDELSPAVWRRPAVKTAANCAACHTAAEQGDFRERNVRVPN